MAKIHITCLACTAVVFTTALGAAPPGAGHKVHTVRPGQSIQKAVNAAAPGDTVLVRPGVYHESVEVTTPGLTLRGSGPRTVLEPGANAGKGTADGPAEAHGKEAGPAKGRREAAGKSAADCAAGGYGICVVGTKGHEVKGVTVASLTVTGFARAGVYSTYTTDLTVRDVAAVRNTVWGIAQERSIHGVFQGNTVRDNGDAGLFIANTVKAEEGSVDTRGTVVEYNRLQGNRTGVTVRRLRDVDVVRNDITGNCVGAFVVGDENKPKAGDLVIAYNRIVRNNKSCPKTARLPALQGSGVVLTGAERNAVRDNWITDHAGTSPLSGGIVLFKSFVGATNDHNRISDNVLRRNSPADLVDADTGKDNTFTDNTCRVSKPAGLC
ncbi:right-handed parallel beta-helix repeat-containing protein [Streptomyces sp. NPDC000987]|uniref:right-handed parallel beta-helix repeat-containing protein n=1 Tax=Streptomyces sp. NPDC000987 TaxID=3154374 RepID=UPI00332DA2E6